MNILYDLKYRTLLLALFLVQSTKKIYAQGLEDLTDNIDEAVTQGTKDVTSAVATVIETAIWPIAIVYTLFEGTRLAIASFGQESENRQGSVVKGIKRIVLALVGAGVIYVLAGKLK